MEGKFSVGIAHVKKIAIPVLRHRVLLTADAEVEGRTSDQELTNLLESLEAPR